MSLDEYPDKIYINSSDQLVCGGNATYENACNLSPYHTEQLADLLTIVPTSDFLFL